MDNNENTNSESSKEITSISDTEGTPIDKSNENEHSDFNNQDNTKEQTYISNTENVSEQLETNSVENVTVDTIDDTSKSSAEVPKVQENGTTTVKHLSNEEVTGHTASLWKYKPIPVDEPESTPEYIHRSLKLKTCNIISARVRGKKHKHEGTNCDDWYEVSNYDDITFIAVSDGAGSKKFSRIGAKKACKSAVGYLLRTFEEKFSQNEELRNDLCLELSNSKCMNACGTLAEVVQQSVIKAYEAVESSYYSRLTNDDYSRLLNRNLQFKDLSATLLITVIVPINTDTKEQLIISCQIGDGMIALINSNGDFENSVKLMGVPDSGDFSGETDFLTSPQMKNIETLQARTKISRSIVDTLFVMTDGVADDYFPNETEMRRLYFDLIANGIIEPKVKKVSNDNLTPEQISVIKKLPDAISYPWVNDQNVKIALQYTNRICEKGNITMNDLWNDQTALELAKMELSDINKIMEPSEKLELWLDNYVERGSFDDRTLVVVQM